MALVSRFTAASDARPPLKLDFSASRIPFGESSAASSMEDSSPTRDELPGPPLNFGEVCPGVYRSSFPKPHNFHFLEGLGLKTVLTLVSDTYPEANQQFMLSNGIIHVQIPIPPNKDTFDSIPLASMERALNIVMDKRNHPILIHCNKGKHRTGCVVGCFRKINDWTMGSILDEYRRYAQHKARRLDERYIELFDEHTMKNAIQHILPVVFTGRRPLTPGSTPPENFALTEPSLPHSHTI